ncbi:16S rRNA (guanine(527)-N(7))-methyltransferase RsmG [Gilvimarinus sp. DA14]|uniref:16S rRNA (guanine(527)-N(7))-methyltransferase RsmG n=1 Tax=Gilvimarinus sp. DA14 TaxID=2956798 RepID=UPI0020B8DF96|nr:16S rRNA (guanine(527)-N(7))-methyltransferase RsmG [Gilvimarinus sp. DA14]UTF59057.1 16S rRNA (guanine(527)-N(7))-methyltransferase RsmG [Gilvimarinus sp. DA14]
MSDRGTLQRQLQEGAASLGVSLSDAQQGLLLDYLQEFAKWNKAYNLSAVRDIQQMLGRHLLDSLAVVPHIHGQNLIDVGTGGGLPGIVLAICYPEKKFTLLDSNGKKTRFLFHVKTLLGLENVTVENCRVESLKPESLFDTVISRAFASLADMTHWCRHLLSDNGQFLAMKGQFPQVELDEIREAYELLSSIELQVPGEEGERHLLIIRRKQS